MALEEDERSGPEGLDRILADEISGYVPPSDEAIESWLESAPHPTAAEKHEEEGSEGDAET